MLLTMPDKPIDGPEDAAMTPARPKFTADYNVDPRLVADAMVSRMSRLAEERERHVSALIESVEVLVAPDFDGLSGRVQ